MSLTTDRNTLVGHLAANYTGLELFLPGEEREDPEPTGRIDAPAGYVVFEVLYAESDERGGEHGRMTFGGTRMRVGVLQHSIWSERIASDHTLLAAADALVSLWRSASLSGFTFFPDDAVLADPVTEGPWEGRALAVPFWLIEEPS